MNNPEYADYLESQLTGCYDREIPLLDDDVLEPEEEPFTCPLCGCNVAAWAGRLGNLIHSNCRNCGFTSYRDT